MMQVPKGPPRLFSIAVDVRCQKIRAMTAKRLKQLPPISRKPDVIFDLPVVSVVGIVEKELQ
jgi:predicted secreted Zn-dependent protease